VVSEVPTWKESFNLHMFPDGNNFNILRGSLATYEQGNLRKNWNNSETVGFFTTAISPAMFTLHPIVLDG
jgi:hypothetical protein